MPKREVTLDCVFHALADGTRRAIVQRLGGGPAAVTELARPFKMALPSFSQHLGVLERCGMVRSHKVGRVRTYHLTPRALDTAEHWMAAQRTMWERRLNQLDNYLEELKERR